MDVSFSGWRREQEGREGLELRGECFSFLFDRRYTNRLNRMSRVFFEAYAKATAELAASEDRFPSLSEIESKMESGAVYAFKDRLTKNTDFFEEVKISGVSYLVPRARSFRDSSGLYTDLSFDFTAGAVELPSRRKVPLPGHAPLSEPLPSEQEAMPEGQDLPEGQQMQDGGISAQPEGVSPLPADLGQMAQDGAGQKAAAGWQEGILPSQPRLPEDGRPVQMEPDLAAGPGTDQPSRQPEEVDEVQPAAQDAASGEEAVFVDLSEAKTPYGGPQPSLEARPSSQSAPPESGVAKPPSSVSSPASAGPAPSATLPAERGPHWKLLLAAGGVVLLLVVGAWMVPGIMPLGPVQAEFIHYSTYLSNLTAGNITSDFLALEMKNPHGLQSELELILPPGVDRSISARGGTVTIKQSGGTTVSLSSSGDSSIRVYLRDGLDSVPVVLQVGVPQGYDSTLQVHDPNYQVTRREGMMVLRFNVTHQRTDFEQSFTPD